MLYTSAEKEGYIFILRKPDSFGFGQKIFVFIRKEVEVMTICPVAMAVGCKKCPLFKICPLKTVLGDQKREKDEKNPDKKEE